MKKLRIFVTGASKDVDYIRGVMTAVKLEHTLVLDWTQDIKKSAGKDHAELIRSSDAMIMIGHPGCKNSLWEWGYAQGLGIPVVILKASVLDSIFSETTFHASTEEHAITLLEELARLRVGDE